MRPVAGSFLDLGDDGLGDDVHEPRPAGLFQRLERVVFRLDRAERDAGGIALAALSLKGVGAGRPRRIIGTRRLATHHVGLAARDGVSGDRRARDAKLGVLAPGEPDAHALHPVLEPAVEMGFRDRLHREIILRREADAGEIIVGLVAGDAELPFRLLVPRREIVIAQRPVHPVPELRRGAKVARLHPQAGPQPVQRRAAERAQIIRPERKRSLLHEISRVVRRARCDRPDIQHGRRGRGGVLRVRAVGNLDRVELIGRVIGAVGFGFVAVIGPRFEDQDALALGREPLGDQRAGNAAADDHRVILAHDPASGEAGGSCAQAPKPCGLAPSGCAPMASHTSPSR